MSSEVAVPPKEGVILGTTEKQRKAILAQMTELTQTVAEKGLHILKAGSRVASLVPYDLGAAINELFLDASLNNEERQEQLKLLSTYWNQPSLGPSTLYDLRNVAASFSRSYIEEQVKEPLNDGITFLTWSHFKELQKISDENKRNKTLSLIRKHSWSAKELQLQLRGDGASDIKRAGGRKPTLPKTPVAILAKTFANVQQTDNFLMLLAEPLEGMFLEMSPDAIDERFLENIENTLEKMSQIEQHLKETRSKLSKVRLRANKVLAGKSVVVAAKKDVSQNDVVPAKKKSKNDKPVRKIKRVKTVKAE